VNRRVIDFKIIFFYFKNLKFKFLNSCRARASPGNCESCLSRQSKQTRQEVLPKKKILKGQDQPQLPQEDLFSRSEVIFSRFRRFSLDICAEKLRPDLVYATEPTYDTTQPVLCRCFVFRVPNCFDPLASTF